MKRLAAYSVILPLLTIFLCAGCGGISEDAKKRLFEKDPAFKNIYEVKKEVDLKIFKLEETFRREKGRLDAEMAVLKAAERKAKLEFVVEARNQRLLLKPYIDMIETELRALFADYRICASSLSSADRKIKEIDKLTEKKTDVNLGQDEITLWLKRKKTLEKEKEEILRNAEALKERIEIKKLELRILKE